ncbi:hypothetical protein LK12_13090 [Novosphingobium malaysiense]|uniref:Thioesterase domain-containing protein n=1 Tax=Novosphingobium malaysiense TaxID=1348853 RepID=A0A0B1ZS55_9SPHN|nr:hypothetical protein LK12_13090 [Novosphingobium malaysiense]
MFERVLSPGARSLGTEFVAYDKAERIVHLSFSPKPEFANILGFVQGGYVAAMLDEAAGMAARLSLPVTRAVPTLTFNVTFLSPCPVTSLVGEGRVVKLGRTTAVLEAKLLGPDGKVLAQMSVTSAVIDVTP